VSLAGISLSDPEAPPIVPGAQPPRASWAAFVAYKWAVAFAAAGVGTLIYESIGRTDLHRSTALLDTALDRAIPLIPFSTWFYEPLYLGVFVVTIFGFRSRAMFHRAVVCVLANMAIAAVGHYFVRAEYPRPILPHPSPDLSTAFLAYVYKIDPPGNVFPSLHVAHSFVLAFLLELERPRWGKVTLVMCVLLAISTLTTKQHFIADVLAGLAMAFTARAWAARSFSRTAPAPVPRRPSPV
jgi:membrane-associated phospholipid phosphatase